MVTLNFLPLDVTFSQELQVSEPLHLGVLVYNVFLAYSADVSWLVALSIMFLQEPEYFMNGFSTMPSINTMTRR